MPRKVKVENIHDDSTYGDTTEAVVENEKAENETNEDTNTEEVGEPDPQPKASTRAKRVSKPKAPERTDTVVDVDTAIELETGTPVLETKPEPKRAAKVKIVDIPLVVEEQPEKPKAVRKPRVKKEEVKEELKIVCRACVSSST